MHARISMPPKCSAVFFTAASTASSSAGNRTTQGTNDANIRHQLMQPRSHTPLIRHNNSMEIAKSSKLTQLHQSNTTETHLECHTRLATLVRPLSRCHLPQCRWYLVVWDVAQMFSRQSRSWRHHGPRCTRKEFKLSAMAIKATVEDDTGTITSRITACNIV